MHYAGLQRVSMTRQTHNMDGGAGVNNATRAASSIFSQDPNMVAEQVTPEMIHATLKNATDKNKNVMQVVAQHMITKNAVQTNLYVGKGYHMMYKTVLRYYRTTFECLSLWSF